MNASNTEQAEAKTFSLADSAPALAARMGQYHEDLQLDVLAQAHIYDKLTGLDETWVSEVIALNDLYEMEAAQKDNRSVRDANQEAKRMIAQLEKQLQEQRRELNSVLKVRIKNLRKLLNADRKVVRDERMSALKEGGK